MISAVEPGLASAVRERAAALAPMFEWLARQRAWTNERHLELCRVAAPTFFEQERAEWMAAQFRALGWEARLDRAGNVVATRPNRAKLAAVAVTAHLDTVLAPRSDDDIKVAPDGRFLGPGVADNGAGLAALLALASLWGAFPELDELPATPVLIANVGEEGEGNLSGMRYLCRNLERRYRSFLVLDGPGTDHITCQALGSRRFEVVFNGPGGHSWNDHGTPNPIHALSRAVATFADGIDSGGPRCSFNFGIVEGGTSINAIPAEARAKVDLRSEDPARIDELAVALTAAVERAMAAENERSESGRVTAKIKEIGSRPAGRLATSSPLLQNVLAVDRHLGLRPTLDCSSTDANVPLSMNMPAVSLGAGGQGGGAHTPGEWYHPEGREAGLRRVLLTLVLELAREA